MKLAILGTRGIPARYGGFETFAEEIGVRLVSHGVEVSVLCPTEHERPDDEYRGVRRKFVRARVRPPLDQLVWDAECLWACRSGYDVIYLLGVGAGFLSWLPRVFGSEVWVNTDGIEWKRQKWGVVGRSYLRLAEATSVLFANRVVADARAIETYLKKAYGRLATTSTVAYGAYAPSSEPSTAPLSRYGIAPGGYYIVVCRLEPENHVLEIIEGHRESRSAAPLLVFGNTDAPNRYVRELLSRRSERVRFVGTEYDPDKIRALRYHARAYMHGHSVGGTNPSLLEAMACENVVLAMENPFNREVLREGGLFFRSPGELADLIRRLESGGIDTVMLRKSARRIVTDEYSWDGIAEQYLALLQEAGR